MKKKYIQLKESASAKKGAIFEEQCDGGNQDFVCLDRKYIKFSDINRLYASRKTVMNQPEWYQEIDFVEVPKKHLAKVKKYIKSLK